MRQHGFTLLEVIVAVVILAVGLSSLFTSEAAAIKMAQRARTTTIATLFARCKMGEIEEQIAKEGWPATELSESDECCEDAERDGFSCEWSVEPIILPEMQQETDLTDPDATGAAGSAPAGAAGSAPAGGPNALNNFGLPLTGNPVDMLSTAGAGEGSDPIASLVLQMAFPVMKPLIEEQVRRITVNVKWKEGGNEQSMSVVQYLVNELPVLATDNEDDDTGAGAGAGAGGQTPAPSGGSTP